MGKILLIIGLPGSGKTYLSKTLKGYVIYDDFISYFWNGKAKKDIKEGKNVCLIDPRLCIPEIFSQYESLFFDMTGGDVQIVLFENDPEQCIKNKPIREKEIKKYSELYDTKIYYDPIIYKVHDSTDNPTSSLFSLLSH